MKNIWLGTSLILHVLEEQLLHYKFELREQGMAVWTSYVIVKSSSLSWEFRERVAIAQYIYVGWFINQHGLVHQSGIQGN